MNGQYTMLCNFPLIIIGYELTFAQLKDYVNYLKINPQNQSLTLKFINFLLIFSSTKSRWLATKNTVNF